MVAEDAAKVADTAQPAEARFAKSSQLGDCVGADMPAALSSPRLWPRGSLAWSE